MLQKPIKYAARPIRRTAGPLYWGAGLLSLLLLAGCPLFNEVYHVYYDGNGNTAGFPPVDSKTYAPGNTAIALAKPEGLKNGSLEFLGWHQPGNDTPFQSGDTIYIGYGDIFLYALWEDDPDHSPYEYTVDSQTGGVTITRYNPYNTFTGAITIPDKLDDKPVTVIGDGAFAGAYLSAIVLPQHLEVIGSKAFAGNWLDTIIIPDTVKSIGKLAFQNSSLRNISLGSGLESIDDYAFDGCSLTVLFLPEKVKIMGEGAFYNNDLASLEISDNVDIQSDTSLGTYGASFRRHYQDENSAAGVYFYIHTSDSWRGPFHE
jgi:hypothetical protein